MKNIIIAQLITNLPDVRAGALFTSLSKDHWQYVNGDEPYDYRQLYYFYNDQYSATLLTDDLQTFLDYENLKDWCVFFDYSCGKFLPLDKVKALTLDILATRGEECR